MKIAKYKHIETGSESIDEPEKWIEDSKNFVRTTEVIEVFFPDLPESTIIPQQVAHLEEAKRAADIAHQVVIAKIDERISKLMAITDQSDG